MAVVEGETEMGRELLGRGGAAYHQLGGALVRLLCLGRAQPAQREQCDAQLQLKLGLSPAALVAFGEARGEGDGAGEVVDRALVRGEPDRTQTGVLKRLYRQFHEGGDILGRRDSAVERGEIVVCQQLAVVFRAAERVDP